MPVERRLPHALIVAAGLFCLVGLAPAAAAEPPAIEGPPRCGRSSRRWPNWTEARPPAGPAAADRRQPHRQRCVQRPPARAAASPLRRRRARLAAGRDSIRRYFRPALVTVEENRVAPPETGRRRRRPAAGLDAVAAGRWGPEIAHDLDERRTRGLRPGGGFPPRPARRRAADAAHRQRAAAARSRRRPRAPLCGGPRCCCRPGRRRTGSSWRRRAPRPAGAGLGRRTPRRGHHLRESRSIGATAALAAEARSGGGAADWRRAAGAARRTFGHQRRGSTTSLGSAHTPRGFAPPWPNCARRARRRSADPSAAGRQRPAAGLRGKDAAATACGTATAPAPGEPRTHRGPRHPAAISLLQQRGGRADRPVILVDDARAAAFDGPAQHLLAGGARRRQLDPVRLRPGRQQHLGPPQSGRAAAVEIGRGGPLSMRSVKRRAAGRARRETATRSKPSGSPLVKIMRDSGPTASARRRRAPAAGRRRRRPVSGGATRFLDRHQGRPEIREWNPGRQPAAPGGAEAACSRRAGGR